MVSGPNTAPILRYDELASTQDEAKALVGRAAAGTSIVAARQSAGRGRLGRAWLGPDEAVFLSMVLEPRCPSTRAAHITLGAAVGVLTALASAGVSARVKWPNDLVIARERMPMRVSESDGKLGPYRKVGGVLVEAVRFSGPPAHGILDACVVGVGINVGAFAWPAELLPSAGSLADAGYRGTVDDVVGAVHRALPAAVAGALADFDGALAILRAHSATLGRRVSHEGVTGLARDIDDDGALVLVDDRGVTHTVRAGDVWLDGDTVSAT